MSKKRNCVPNFGLPDFPDARFHRHVATYGFAPGDVATVRLDCKGFTHVYIYTVVSEDAIVDAFVDESESSKAY